MIILMIMIRVMVNIVILIIKIIMSQWWQTSAIDQVLSIHHLETIVTKYMIHWQVYFQKHNRKKNDNGILIYAKTDQHKMASSAFPPFHFPAITRTKATARGGSVSSFSLHHPRVLSLLGHPADGNDVGVCKCSVIKGEWVFFGQ